MKEEEGQYGLDWQSRSTLYIIYAFFFESMEKLEVTN